MESAELIELQFDLIKDLILFGFTSPSDEYPKTDPILALSMVFSIICDEHFSNSCTTNMPFDMYLHLAIEVTEKLIGSIPDNLVCIY